MRTEWDSNPRWIINRLVNSQDPSPLGPPIHILFVPLVKLELTFLSGRFLKPLCLPNCTTRSYILYKVFLLFTFLLFVCAPHQIRTDTFTTFKIVDSANWSTEALKNCSPYGIRTHIVGLEDRCPYPLNEGTISCR